MTEDNVRILIVDDEKMSCRVLSSLLKREGFNSLVAHDRDKALEMIRSEAPDMMLAHVKIPGMDGMKVLKEAKNLDQDLPVVLITGHAELHEAVGALETGAHDYLIKPFDNHEMIRVIHRALDKRALKRKLRSLSSRFPEKVSLKEKMGPSNVVTRLISDANRVAGSDFTVVILGETGAGKELVARAIHQASPRFESPFIPVDCGAIPETLLESELFGHEKGAFTGADTQRRGKFEMAQDGTLFMDEISNMPLGSQAKLLRVLQEKKVYRVGGTQPLEVNVRLLAASNQDLSGLTSSGSFRRDLFYRLNEFTITIPPLRERKEDIPYLAKRFLDTANIELNKRVRGFSESALNVLFSYPWPGNVRQLRSTIRRATLMAHEMITEKDLDLKRVPVPGLAFTPKVQGMPWKDLSLKEIVAQSIEAVEREVLSQVLKYTGGNKAKAARLLQVDYKTIHTKLKKLGILTDLGEEIEK
jgi:DNA-binding NtrC family response regulator